MTISYESKEIFIKGVPQTGKISKLESIFSKFPSQLEIGGEHLFWGTARGVLFKSHILTSMMPNTQNHRNVMQSCLLSNIK